MLMVCLINGIFGECFPLDSEAIPINNEHISNNLSKSYSDIAWKVAGHPFHLEEQINKKKLMTAECFDYDYFLAKEVWQDNPYDRDFPSTCVIYPGRVKNIEEKSTFRINFRGSETFNYSVKNFFAWIIPSKIWKRRNCTPSFLFR